MAYAMEDYLNYLDYLEFEREFKRHVDECDRIMANLTESSQRLTNVLTECASMKVKLMKIETEIQTAANDQAK